MRRALPAVALALVLGTFRVDAVESTTWPPPPEVLGKMRDLQATIASPDTSKEERAAARRELERLMKSAAGQDTPSADRKPARAAIDPFPSVVKPIEDRLPGPPPPTARLEVIPDPPRRPAINPATGGVVQPSAPGFAVDPRTGGILHETPAGYVDPRTGRFVPK